VLSPGFSGCTLSTTMWYCSGREVWGHTQVEGSASYAWVTLKDLLVSVYFWSKLHTLETYTAKQCLLPATHGWLVLRLLCIFRVCMYLCASVLITCAIITSRTLLPCDLNFGSLDSCFMQLLNYE